MPYMNDVAESLIETLRTFVTLNRHQLAGNAANIEFWFDETRHCLEVIDGYRRRIEAIKKAQANYVAKHHTVNLDYESIAPAKANVPDHELKRIRADVVDAAYKFALRSFKEQIIAQAQFRDLTERIGTTIDPADLR